MTHRLLASVLPVPGPSTRSGYHADADLMRRAGIQVNDETLEPAINTESHSTRATLDGMERYARHVESARSAPTTP